MKGSLMESKSKVILSLRPKSEIIRKKIKKEFSTTPQRWSRRIRMLPPIPINVLKTRRKSKAIKREEPSFTTILSNLKKETLNVVSKKSRIMKKKPSRCNTQTVEIVRIVPVVVYVSKDKPHLKPLSDDIKVLIKPRSLQDVLGDDIQKKIKQECDQLEKKWSRKLKRTTTYKVLNIHDT